MASWTRRPWSSGLSARQLPRNRGTGCNRAGHRPLASGGVLVRADGAHGNNAPLVRTLRDPRRVVCFSRGGPRPRASREARSSRTSGLSRLALLGSISVRVRVSPDSSGRAGQHRRRIGQRRPGRPCLRFHQHSGSPELFSSLLHRLADAPCRRSEQMPGALGRPGVEPPLSRRTRYHRMPGPRVPLQYISAPWLLPPRQGRATELPSLLRSDSVHRPQSPSGSPVPAFPTTAGRSGERRLRTRQVPRPAHHPPSR